MVFYLSGNFQFFKEDLALWVVLVYDTRSNNSLYNNARFMQKLYSFLCMQELYINYISFFTCCKQTDGRYSLHRIEKLKDFTEQFKSGLILFP